MSRFRRWPVLVVALTDAVVCAARPSAAGPVFRCKGRAAIQRDVGKGISPDWAARVEKDYRDIVGLLGIGPTSAGGASTLHSGGS